MSGSRGDEGGGGAENGAFVDHYETFGVSRAATEADLKRRYQSLLLQYHPDKRRQRVAEGASSLDNDADDKHAEWFLQRVQDAWKVLKDPDARAAYDSSLTNRMILQEHPINATVDLDDMVWDEDTGRYSLECRCGGEYVITEDELASGCDEVGCSVCSLAVRVAFEAVDDEDDEREDRENFEDGRGDDHGGADDDSAR